MLQLIPGSWLTYNPTKVVEPLWNIPHPTHCSTLSSSYNLTLHSYPPPTLFIMNSTNRMMNNSWTMSHHHTSPATLSFIIFYNTQPSPSPLRHRSCCHHCCLLLLTMFAQSHSISKTFNFIIASRVDNHVKHLHGQQEADIIISSHLTIERILL